MSARRIKLTLLLAGIALSGLIFLAWTQQWFSITLDDGPVLRVDGDIGAPAVSTLALTGLVLIGALSIAGPFFRAVLGVLQALLGATIVLSGVLALMDPIAASSAVITEATAVAGKEAVAGMVASAAVTAWPWVSTISGALLTILGVVVLMTGRLWPGSSRKYSAVRTRAVGGGDPVEDWDSLSSGEDPTKDA